MSSYKPSIFASYDDWKHDIETTPIRSSGIRNEIGAHRPWQA